MDGVVFDCAHCTRCFLTSSGRSQHERRVHPEEYHGLRGASDVTNFAPIVPPPRREDGLDCVTGVPFGRRDRVATLVELCRLEGVVAELSDELRVKGEGVLRRCELESVEEVLEPTEDDLLGEGPVGEQLMGKRSAWCKAFEKDRRRTVDRIFQGQSLRGSRRLPDGSREFWQGIFSDSSKPGLLGLVDRMRYEKERLYLCMSTPVTNHEVVDVLSEVSGSSAAGPDGIKKGALMKVDTDVIVDIFNKFLDLGKVPSSLKQFKMHLLPKKEGATEPSDHRPLNVGNLMRRLFSSVLVGRMSVCLKQGMGQRGFQRGVEGVYLNVGMLSLCIKENVKRRRSVSYAYLDMKKAFDSVKHSEMLKVLALHGVPKQLVALLADMYSGNTSVLQNGEVLHLEKGVLQGDPLSPLLFNLVLDEALRSIRGQGEVGFGFTNRKGRSKDYSVGLGYLAYADDLVVFANCPGQLVQKISVLTERLGEYGLTLDARKSVVCHLVKYI